MRKKSIDLLGRQIADRLIPAADIEGDDEEDTRLLERMTEDARDYISSFAWCDEIHETYFGGGVGGIFSVFLFRIRPGRQEVDPWIWIIVGDIPSAYLPLSDAESPREVFETYVDGMNRWVNLARNSDKKAASASDVPPVNLPRTPEWAEKLKTKLDCLEQAIKPYFVE